MLRVLTVASLLIWAGVAAVAMPPLRFQSIDGGVLDMSLWAGQPVLVVNAASQCAYTGQYADLQRLYDTYRAAGLVVLAVPSDDFRQELGSAAEVKEFCEITFGLDMPMADITPVTGAQAHPFYQWVKAETGFVPRWNFNKVLIGADGAVVETWGARTGPMARPVVDAVEKALAAAGS
jgi:glutathione peroxidase